MSFGSQNLATLKIAWFILQVTLNNLDEIRKELSKAIFIYIFWSNYFSGSLSRKQYVCMLVINWIMY